MIQRTGAVLLLAATPALLRAQPAPPVQAAPEPGISDNIFLIEEAYNQEPGVVQHISAFLRASGSGDWIYTFIQEWPVPGQRHQVSLTLPVSRVTGPEDAQSGRGTTTGLGDVALNYRLQAAGMGEGARRAFAPRLSLLLPTGSAERGLGAGGPVFQANLPLSISLGRRFVTHWNAGGTWAPSAKNRVGEEAAITIWNLGQSVVWLVRSRLNLLVETSWLRSQSVAGPGRTETRDSLFVNPGIRWAWNCRNGLQIVPGLSAPIGLGPSRGNRSLFVYLSFEHPFRRGASGQ